MNFVSKATLEGLADARFEDAVMLLQAGRFSGAYYLSGYCVEYALKACICRIFQAAVLPDKKFVADLHSHNPVRIVQLARLDSELARTTKENPRFSENWKEVTLWSESSRYVEHDAIAAHRIIDAIGNADDGVLQWIKHHW